MPNLAVHYQIDLRVCGVARGFAAGLTQVRIAAIKVTPLSSLYPLEKDPKEP